MWGEIMNSMPGRLQFNGTEEAELFSKEIDSSIRGVLRKNFISDPNNDMQGFLSASIDGRPWTDTMWTRDAGVFLRELVQWGYFFEAKLLVENLIKLVLPNKEGFYTFPEYFKIPIKKSKTEGFFECTENIINGETFF